MTLTRFLLLAEAVAFGAAAALAQPADLSFGSPFRFQQQDGEALYRGVCQGCHMADGQGAVGAGRYPPLARNERLAAGDYAVHVVLHGQKAMPPFARYLNDAQVAAVVNYVRSHFGNAYADSVSVEEVKGAR